MEFFNPDNFGTRQSLVPISFGITKSDFNTYKIVLSSVAVILALFTTFYPYRRKHSYFYYTITMISWLVVGYVISLERDAKNWTDIDKERLMISLPATFMIGTSLLFFLFYDKRHKRYYLYYVAGIVLIVFGKAGVVIAELGLRDWSHILCIFSTALVVTGSLIELLNLQEKEPTLFRFSRIVVVIGWLLFGFNLSYNPTMKKVQPQLIGKVAETETNNEK